VGRTRPQVLITRRLPQEALDRIEARCDMTLYDGEGTMARDQLLTEVAGKAGAITLLTDRVDDEFLDAAGPQLKIVANYAVGFDNIDVDACTRHGVLTSNTPEVLTETTADAAFALMMAAARRVAEGDRFLRSRTPWIWGPLMMLGQDVHHKTLGIVGFGRIGQALARRARGFAMRVLYHDTCRPPAEVEQELAAEYRDLEDLLRESDFVSLHTTLTAQTRHLINAERLAMMKPTAVLVNTSRGPAASPRPGPRLTAPAGANSRLNTGWCSRRGRHRRRAADPDDLRGGRRAPRRFIDWQTFFDSLRRPCGRHRTPGTPAASGWPGRAGYAPRARSSPGRPPTEYARPGPRHAPGCCWRRTR